MVDTTAAAEVVTRNVPTAAVVGGSLLERAADFPITPVVQWLTGVWILTQLFFYLLDRYRKETAKNGSQ